MSGPKMTRYYVHGHVGRVSYVGLNSAVFKAYESHIVYL